MSNHKNQRRIPKTVFFAAFVIILEAGQIFASNNNNSNINFQKIVNSGIPRTWSVPIQLNTVDFFETEKTDDDAPIAPEPQSTDFKTGLQSLNDGIPIDPNAFCRAHDEYMKLKKNLKQVEQTFVGQIVAQEKSCLSTLIDPKNKIENLSISDHYLDNLTFDNLLLHISDETKRREAADYVSRESEKIQKTFASFIVPLDKIMRGHELWKYWKQCLCSKPMDVHDKIKIITKGKTSAGINSSTTIFVSLNDFLQTNPDLRAKFDMNLFYKISSEIRLIATNILIHLEPYFTNNDETWLLFKWGCLAGDICIVSRRHIIGDILGNATSEVGEFRSTLASYGTTQIVQLFDVMCSTRTKLELTIFKCEAMARAIWGQDWVKGGQEAVRTQEAARNSF